MEDKDKNILIKLGVFKAKDAEESIGVSRFTISRWAQKGLLLKIERGLYMHPDCPIPPEEMDYASACAHFGQEAFIGGLSALFHYGLIEQIPAQTWVVLPHSKKSESSLKKFQTMRTSTPSNTGIEKKKYYKIATLERTLVESLKFSTKIGGRIALGAIRKALAEGLTTEKKLGTMAKKLGLESTLDKYWEAIA